MSDEVAETLLSPIVLADEAGSPLAAITRELRAAGQAAPSEAVAERHLAAIISEVQSPREAPVGVAPRQAGRSGMGALSRLVPPRLAGGFTAFTVLAALVVGGALPGPVQAAAADVLGVVGISVPDGRSVAKTLAEPVRRNVTPGDSSPERKAEQPQREQPAVRHDDRDRLETPTTREVDDGAHGSRDDERDESSGDDGDERRSGSDPEPDDDGSDREPDAPDDADDGPSGDEPDTESIDPGDVDEIDEIDELDGSGSGSEDRSAPSDAPLPEPDSTEE